VATYALGDIQGCYRSLLALLERIEFKGKRDRLRLVGDLVNRGPRSLDVLRWARERGDEDVCVLGNHDLNLLAVAHGVRRVKASDTLDEILAAPDRKALLEWLLARPLLHREGDVVLVHAGLAPQWTLDEAESLARETEAALRSDPEGVLRDAFEGPKVDRWGADLGRRKRIRFALDVFTRLRVVTPDGRVDRDYGGSPGESYAPDIPWFAASHPRGAEALVLFGHWSALGFHRAPGAVCLDSGCVWGKTLTAYRIEDGSEFSQPNVE